MFLVSFSQVSEQRTGPMCPTIWHCVEPGSIFLTLVWAFKVKFIICWGRFLHTSNTHQGHIIVLACQEKVYFCWRNNRKRFSFLTQLVTWNWPCLYQVIKAVECDRRIIRSSPLFLWPNPNPWQLCSKATGKYYYLWFQTQVVYDIGIVSNATIWFAIFVRI